jgi:hypothetical protein
VRAGFKFMGPPGRVHVNRSSSAGAREISIERQTIGVLLHHPG